MSLVSSSITGYVQRPCSSCPSLIIHGVFVFIFYCFQGGEKIPLIRCSKKNYHYPLQLIPKIQNNTILTAMQYSCTLSIPLSGTCQAKSYSFSHISYTSRLWIQNGHILAVSFCKSRLCGVFQKKTIQVKLARLIFVNYHFILLTGEIMTHSKFYWPDLTSK